MSISQRYNITELSYEDERYVVSIAENIDADQVEEKLATYKNVHVTDFNHTEGWIFYSYGHVSKYLAVTNIVR